MQSNTQQQVVPFDFQGNQVRVLRDEQGEPWFVAVDVCRCLGISNPTQALSRLDTDEKSQVVDFCAINSDGFSHMLNIVNEPGLYAFIFSSRNPQSREFKRWATHEVLPAIRKTGFFSISDVSRLLDEGRKDIPETAYVYIVRSTKSNAVKIGVTTNVEQRMATLHFGYEAPYELVGCIPVPYGSRFKYEKALQDKLGRNQLHGEWFEAYDLVAAKELMQ